MPDKQDQSAVYYVGVGVSAGGLEAVDSFIKHFPAECNLAFITVFVPQL